MNLSHKKLIDLMQRAYSAEKAAAFAYYGHSGSLKNKEYKTAVKQNAREQKPHQIHR